MLQDFSRTENRILGALATLDDFLMNPLLQGHSGTTPETSRNVFSINQGTDENDFQNDPVASHLRSVRSEDPLNKGHPRSIKKETKV